MEFKTLGQTTLQVSKICLGTMTWGEQNTEAEAHEQLDLAMASGVNFIDTAEIYPVPPRKETYAHTETIIGNWIARRGKRDRFILASKIAGPARSGDEQNYIRGGSRFSREQIFAACDASLKRLQTDYLDLYQLHWPDRHVNNFGTLGISTIDDNRARMTAFLETISALDDLVQMGKIRYYGLSNETPWGVMEQLRLSREHNLCRAVSVQNPYNLLNRSYEIGLAEISQRENIGLLAYSPLAFGMLTGKYLQKPWDENWRIAKFPRFQRYTKPQGVVATQRYSDIARDAGMSLTQMALAFVNQQPFVTSNIIGATNLQQLQENLSSAAITLSPEVIRAINDVHAEISNPCP